MGKAHFRLNAEFTFTSNAGKDYILIANDNYYQSGSV
jgi:hypothetical protein